MSELGNAEFFISVDTSQLVSGSQQAKQVFQEMSQSGLDSMQTVQTEVNNTSNVFSKIPAAVEPAKASISSLIMPMTGLAASAASLYFSFDQLEQASIRVEQGHLRVEKAQDAVNKLIADGKQGTDQYSQAVQNLSIQQERYDTSQQMVNQNMVFMGLSMVTMATSTIPGVVKAVQALQITQEDFAVVLEATMPWLAAITAALLAWEYVIAPLIKQHYNLDLGIQSNVSKLVAQHSQVKDNTDSFNAYTGTLGTVDGSLTGTASSFDSLGNSISTATAKLTDMDQAFQQLMTTGSFSTQGTSLLSQNDAYTQSMAQINQIQSIESDIQKLMDNHVDKQTAINEVMDHYLTQLQEEAFQTGESNDQLQKKVDLLNQAVTAATALVNVSTQQASLDKKKAELNQFGMTDSDWQKLTASLAIQMGLTQQQIVDTFSPGGAGNAFNAELQELWDLNVRNFGSQFVNSPLGQQIGMWGALPNQESVGNSGPSGPLSSYSYSIGGNYGGSAGGMGGSDSSVFSGMGNIGGPVGGLHNDDIWNALVTMVAQEHMFPGVSINTYNGLNRKAVEQGEAQAQSTFEQDSSQWQMFYALRDAGLFTGDPTLSMEDNLNNAQAAYEAIFTGLRPDVASALEAANEQSYSYYYGKDARSPGILVTHYTYETPSADALAYARADSVFGTEAQFQDVLGQAKSVLGLTQKQIIDSLANPLTVNDVQDELDFQARLAAMSSGA